MTSTTRRRAINSPSTDDRQSLLTESESAGDHDHVDDADADDGDKDEGLTLMEQVVLMGMKDRQVPTFDKSHNNRVGIFEFYE